MLMRNGGKTDSAIVPELGITQVTMLDCVGKFLKMGPTKRTQDHMFFSQNAIARLIHPSATVPSPSPNPCPSPGKSLARPRAIGFDPFDAILHDLV